jgi:hypothetical protein
MVPEGRFIAAMFVAWLLNSAVWIFTILVVMPRGRR